MRQHSIYMEDEDWGALRHYCLDHDLTVSGLVSQAVRFFISKDQPLVTVGTAPTTSGTIPETYPGPGEWPPELTYSAVVDPKTDVAVELVDDHEEAVAVRAAIGDPDLEIVDDLLDSTF